MFTDQTKLNHACQSDVDCDPPFIICENQSIGFDGICNHKTLFPITSKETAGLFVIIGVGMIAIAGGLGGGSLFVPLMMIFFDMNAHHAVPLSNALTFANSVVKYAFSTNEKHPYISHRPVIDFNVAIIFTPMMMLGSFVGVIFHIILPGTVSLLLLFVTLVTSSSVGFKTGFKLFKKETEEQQKLDDEKKMELLPLDKKDSNNKIQKFSTDLNEQESSQRENMIQKISQKEAEIFPMDKMKLVVGSFVVTVLAPILIGGRATDSIIGIEVCTALYVIGALIYFAVVLFLWKTGSDLTMSEEIEKSKIPGEWPYADKEAIKWEKGRIINLSLYMFCVGVFSAIIGVGGGIYIVPT